jgi:hypothetical protein
MLTKFDQLIDHVPDLRPQMRDLWPDGMHINWVRLVIFQHFDQPPSLQVFSEQAARHLAQACPGDGGKNHRFAVSYLMRRRWRITDSFRALPDAPRQRLAATMADDAMVMA